MAATALSPRPEEAFSAATIRRRLGGTSPNIGDDGLLSPSFGDLTPRLGPHRNDDLRSPDLDDEETIRRVDAPRTIPKGRFFGIPLTPVPEHQFPPPQPCPQPHSESLPTSIPLPPSRPHTNPPPIIVSSPSRTSAGSSRPVSVASLAKELPRLPTPDLTGVHYKQALTAPLSFFKRGESVSAEPRRTSYLEKLRQWPADWGWKGRVHGQPPELDRSSSGGSTFSASTSSSFGSAGVLPRPEAYPRRSLKDAYYLRRERRIEEDEEDLLEEHGSPHRSRPRRRDTILHPISVPLKPPQHRYPTLRSPNLSSSSSEDSTTLAAILPALQETSIRFTQKFPWAARNGLGGKGVRLSEDGAAVDAMGVSLFDDEGFGVEGVGRWNGFKWVLMASVITVSVLQEVSALDQQD